MKRGKIMRRSITNRLALFIGCLLFLSVAVVCNGQSVMDSGKFSGNMMGSQCSDCGTPMSAGSCSTCGIGGTYGGGWTDMSGCGDACGQDCFVREPRLGIGAAIRDIASVAMTPIYWVASALSCGTYADCGCAPPVKREYCEPCDQCGNWRGCDYCGGVGCSHCARGGYAGANAMPGLEGDVVDAGTILNSGETNLKSEPLPATQPQNPPAEPARKSLNPDFMKNQNSPQQPPKIIKDSPSANYNRPGYSGAPMMARQQVRNNGNVAARPMASAPMTMQKAPVKMTMVPASTPVQNGQIVQVQNNMAAPMNMPVAVQNAPVPSNVVPVQVQQIQVQRPVQPQAIPVQAQAPQANPINNPTYIFVTPEGQVIPPEQVQGVAQPGQPTNYQIMPAANQNVNMNPGMNPGAIRPVNYEQAPLSPLEKLTQTLQGGSNSKMNRTFGK